MMFATLVLATIAAGLAVRARALDLSHLIAATLLFPILGAYLLAGGGNVSLRPAMLMTMALSVFVIGYGVISRVVTPRPRGASEGLDRPSFAVTRGFVYLGVVTHFVRGGVPILAANPELARLNFTSSGLLGVPGRLYLFGLPFVVALTAWEARRAGVSLWRYRAFQLCFLFFTISRALSGFKSAYLEVLLVLGIIMLTGRRPPSVKRTVVALSVPVAASLLAAYLVGTMYATYETSSGGARRAFIDRLTSDAAISTVVVLDDAVPRFGTSPALRTDFMYYARSYFHVGPGYPFAFERVVSASLVGGSPTDPYLSPVTTGAFADIYFDEGVWVALGGMVLLGGLGAVVVNVGRGSERRPLRYMFVFASAMAMYDYMTKGSLAYNLLNFLAIAVLLALVARIELLVQYRRKENVASPTPLRVAGRPSDLEQNENSLLEPL